MGAVLGPAIGIGTSLFGGWLGSRESGMQKDARQYLGTSMKNLTGAGQQAMGYAKDQYTLASPAYSQALQYYQRLLGGNRGQMALATAAPRAAITDVYRGAERGLSRGMVRGGERDLATAELNRDRASKLAGLVTGVQPMAASQLATLSGQGLDRAGNFLNSGVSAFGTGANAAASAYKAATDQAERSSKAWGAAGKNIFDILSPLFKKGGGSGLPSVGSGGFPGDYTNGGFANTGNPAAGLPQTPNLPGLAPNGTPIVPGATYGGPDWGPGGGYGPGYGGYPYVGMPDYWNYTDNPFPNTPNPAAGIPTVNLPAGW